MAAPSTSSVIILCPHCRTRYRLPREVVGEGRLVKCANCAESWRAAAVPAPLPSAQTGEPGDELFDDAMEERLDAAFAAEAQALEDAPPEGLSEASVEEIKRAIAPRPKRDRGPDPAAMRKQLQAFSKRQATIRRKLPMGRFRHTVRIAALTALMVLVGGGILWRQSIVRQMPDMAGVYAAIGLPVNVVGLEFTGVKTLEMLSEGSPVLIVSGRISSVSEEEVPVPPVVVTLLTENGGAVYEWSVTPRAHELRAGEGIDFETRLTQPPPDAARVRLSFGSARPQAVAPQGNTKVEGH